ncbi:MAG: hypothetical protein WCO54_06220, partial [Bacteroidota bacterium]
FIYLTSLLLSYDSYKVSLGKLPDCNGFNFCSITKDNSNSKKENEVLAYINVNDEKHIEFSFIKRSISDKLFLKYFSTGTFLLDEDFIFSSEICETLKINRCKLKQGKYEILDNYDKYVVVFTCY